MHLKTLIKGANSCFASASATPTAVLEKRRIRGCSFSYNSEKLALGAYRRQPSMALVRVEKNFVANDLHAAVSEVVNKS